MFWMGRGSAEALRSGLSRRCAPSLPIPRASAEILSILCTGILPGQTPTGAGFTVTISDMTDRYPPRGSLRGMGEDQGPLPPERTRPESGIPEIYEVLEGEAHYLLQSRVLTTS